MKKLNKVAIGCGIICGVILCIITCIFITFYYRHYKGWFLEPSEFNKQKILEKVKEWGNEKFSTEKWIKANPERRGAMCYDLLKNHKLIGLSECHFFLKLGEETDYVDDGLLCYQVGKEKFKEMPRYSLCFTTKKRWKKTTCPWKGYYHKDREINGFFLYDWSKRK